MNASEPDAEATVGVRSAGIAALGASKGRVDVDSVKVKLIRAGEALFAEKGIEATSLREIAASADQRNNNAVKYHFGSKMGLLRAIFDYRVALMHPERQAMLECLGEEGRMDSLPDLLRVLFLPQLKLIDAAGNSSHAKVMIQYVTRYRTRGIEHAGDVEQAHTKAIRQTVRLIAECIPHVPALLVRERIELCNLMCQGMIVRWEGREAPDKDKYGLDQRLADVISMATGALLAPASSGS
jgi:AcrR family transcriptional regulator